MIAIRMLVDADGAPHGHTVYPYTAGEVYTPESQPPATEWLMSAFVVSGRAVEVDAAGNPVATPAAKRARKAVASDVTEDAAEASSDAPAPSEPAEPPANDGE